MQVTEITPEIWNELKGREVSDPKNVAAEVIVHGADTDPFICLFTSLDGSSHFMVALSDEVDEDIVNLRGVTSQVLKNHVVLGRPRQSYLDLRCSVDEYLLPFTRVIQDAATLILRDKQSPDDAIVRVAEAWKAFWAAPPRAPLSEAQQRGLIGELLALRRLQALIQVAASAWAGPLEDRHDFRGSTFAVEVKTCLGLPRRHFVNSLQQLSATGGIPLFLLSIVLDLAAGTPLTLPSLVEELERTLPPAEREVFRSKLSAVGYSPLHREEYSRQSYVEGEARAYEVKDDFPRLDQDSFARPLPPAIEKVGYTINLDNEPFISADDLLVRMGL